MVKKAVAPAQKPAAAGATKVAPKKAARPSTAASAKSAPASRATATAEPAATKTAGRSASKPSKNPPKEAVNKATKATTATSKSAPAKEPAAAKSTPAKAAAAKAPAKAVADKDVAKAAPAKPATKKPEAEPAASGYPPVKGETKEGIKYTKDFDAKFLSAQWKLLTEARISLTGQATRLEDEANSLIAEDMGDVQFDEESGEGDTMVVERERDLFLSARVRQDIEEIDGALRRLADGTYGYSVISFRPIPRERLEAIPWATELTEEKVGGIGRR